MINDNIRRQIESDYIQYNQKVEQANREVNQLKERYRQYEIEIEMISRRLEEMGI